MAAPVTTGDTAPGFVLDAYSSERGEHLLDLNKTKGSWVVIYFYPRDMTPGCTVQADDFSALRVKFASNDCAVVGLSKDSIASHERFCQKRELGITLVSDPDAAVADSYGAWVDKSMYGRIYKGIDRSTFLVDPTGIVRRVWRKVKPKGHASEVLEALLDESAR